MLVCAAYRWYGCWQAAQVRLTRQTPANYELDAIAAATVGGTSHTGGICRVSGVLAGILILGVINNGLVMLKVDDNMTNIVKGVIIVGSVVLDMRKKQSARKTDTHNLSSLSEFSGVAAMLRLPNTRT